MGGTRILRIKDPVLRSLIQALSDFERRALHRHLSGVGDSYGREVFWRLKQSLKRQVRAKSFARR
jgi:hypothetical protein